MGMVENEMKREGKDEWFGEEGASTCISENDNSHWRKINPRLKLYFYKLNRDYQALGKDEWVGA